MIRKVLFILLVSMVSLMMSLGAGASRDAKDDGGIIIGMNGINDLTSALNAMKENSGDVVIYLTDSISLNQVIEIPADLIGLKSVTLASYYGNPVTVAMNGSVICAKGVPFTVDQNVSLSNGFLIGGNCLTYEANVVATNADIVINGSADCVIGGGLAMVPGASSAVDNVNIVINGKAGVVHGGGYAVNGGSADVNGTANLVLMRSGAADVMYGGGYANGAGSSAAVNAARITVLGRAGSVNENAGLSENGGRAYVGSETIGIVNNEQKSPDLPYSQDHKIDYPVQQQPVKQPTPEPMTIEQWPVDRRNSTMVLIGNGQQARNFTEAVSMLPRYAGDVEFRLIDNFYQAEDVLIPTNRGITSLTITGNSSMRVTVSWPESGGFFANGIPTTIAGNVRFNEGILYGGANVVSGQKSYLESTYLDIEGTVSRVIAGSKASGAGAEAHVGKSILVFRGKATSWLHAGGGALYGGLSMIDDTASLLIDSGASVDFSVTGGGYAFGAGARSVVQNAYLDISGSITYAVFLGGYADQSSASIIPGQATLYLQPDGRVGQSVWYGGRAYNNSEVYVDTASANVSGYVGVAVHKYGNASGGGETSIRVVQ